MHILGHSVPSLDVLPCWEMGLQDVDQNCYFGKPHHILKRRDFVLKYMIKSLWIGLMLFLVLSRNKSESCTRLKRKRQREK